MSVYGTVNKKYISMSYTADQKNTKTFQIVSWSKAVKYFNIAVIAGSSSKMEDP
jgi:hypothetical protein